MRRGDSLRWSRTTELVAWAVWQIVMSMPFLEHQSHHRQFYGWLKDNTPPGFIPPNQRD
jgi:hypothetical protein